PLTEQGLSQYKENQEAFKNRSFANEFAAAGITSYPEMAHIIRERSIMDLKLERSKIVMGTMEETPKSVVEAPLHWCTPPGLPRIMAAPYPFQIVQTPRQVTILYEMNRVFRTIRLDAQHANPDFWDPTYTGESVGHWEGNTLVIDTTNFNEL